MTKAEVKHINAALNDIKQDIRELRTLLITGFAGIFITLGGMMVAGYLHLADMMAHGSGLVSATKH